MKDSQVVAVDLDGTLTLTDTLHESVLNFPRIRWRNSDDHLIYEKKNGNSS